MANNFIEAQGSSSEMKAGKVKRTSRGRGANLNPRKTNRNQGDATVEKKDGQKIADCPFNRPPERKCHQVGHLANACSKRPARKVVRNSSNPINLMENTKTYVVSTTHC